MSHASDHDDATHSDDEASSVGAAILHDAHEEPVPEEPKTPLWLTALGGGLFFLLAVAWLAGLATESGDAEAAAAASASAAAAALPAPAQKPAPPAAPPPLPPPPPPPIAAPPAAIPPTPPAIPAPGAAKNAKKPAK